MPYIKKDRRAVIDNWLEMISAKVDGESDLPAVLASSAPQDCGELNYALTMTCIGHNRIQFGGLDLRLQAIGKAYLLAAPMRYQRINDFVGACTCAAIELERRRSGAKKFEVISLHHVAQSLYSTLGVAYEIAKIEENGDIDYGEAADAAMIRQKAWGLSDEQK